MAKKPTACSLQPKNWKRVPDKKIPLSSPFTKGGGKGDLIFCSAV
jgi:hypothetical protein